MGNGPLANNIIVLDKDSFNVFVHNTETKKSSTIQVKYEATDNIYSFNKQANTQMLPHNF